MKSDRSDHERKIREEAEKIAKRDHLEGFHETEIADAISPFVVRGFEEDDLLVVAREGSLVVTAKYKSLVKKLGASGPEKN